MDVSLILRSNNCDSGIDRLTCLVIKGKIQPKLRHRVALAPRPVQHELSQSPPWPTAIPTIQRHHAP